MAAGTQLSDRAPG